MVKSKLGRILQEKKKNELWRHAWGRPTKCNACRRHGENIRTTQHCSHIPAHLSDLGGQIRLSNSFGVFLMGLNSQYSTITPRAKAKCLLQIYYVTPHPSIRQLEGPHRSPQIKSCFSVGAYCISRYKGTKCSFLLLFVLLPLRIKTWFYSAMLESAPQRKFWSWLLLTCPNITWQLHLFGLLKSCLVSVSITPLPNLLENS